MQVQRDFPPGVASVLEKIDLRDLEARLADYGDETEYDDKAALHDPALLAELREAALEADAGQVSPPLRDAAELQAHLDKLKDCS